MLAFFFGFILLSPFSAESVISSGFSAARLSSKAVPSPPLGISTAGAGISQAFSFSSCVSAPSAPSARDLSVKLLSGASPGTAGFVFPVSLSVGCDPLGV